MSDYDSKNLLEAYSNLGLNKGRVVYWTGNVGVIGNFEVKSKNDLLKAHLEIIFELIGPSGTLVVPTHTWSICNTTTPFDLLSSKSETGVFTEFVRNQSGSVRQRHPFSSSTALGAFAMNICTNNSKHVYGANSPFERLIQADAIHVSVGMPVNLNISLVHHAEFVMGVPYRYTKEFVHPCVSDGIIKNEEFYIFVNRLDVDVVRDKNIKLVNHFGLDNKIHSARLGRGFVHSVEMTKFYKSTVDYLSKDIYGWLRHPPLNRAPYRN